MSDTVGKKITIAIAEGLAAIPDKTDAGFGTDTSALKPSAQRGPTRIKLYLESSLPVSWQNVRVHVFDGDEWATLAVGGTGDVFLASKTWVKAGMPDSFVLYPSGLVERMAISVGSLNSAVPSATVQRVEAE